jgi:TPR repeat protein
MNRDGNGVEQNLDLAQKYMKMAAALNHPDAEQDLRPEPAWNLGSMKLI